MIFMNWLNEIVDEIIEKYPNEKVYTCECGLSTTGVSHIGNFRELIITYFVSKELERRGKKTKVILSFDDFDQLKKVTRGVDSSFEKYIGMPNYTIPAPYGNNCKYAEYFEDLVINELSLLGINMNYVKQSERYLKGCYNDKIKLALDKKNDIYDIIKKYKSKEFIEKNKYYPVSLYCSKCLKNSTNILNYDKINKTIEYNCTCGHHEINNIESLKIKLNFSVDWAMRWNYENVVFEPCGKGHADKNGVLNVSRDISKHIFDDRQPVSLTYEFVNFKGKGGRLNKNSKNIITITDALNILPKDMILWMFLTNNPKKEYNISFDNSIINLYKDYEKILISNNELNTQIKNIIGDSSISAEPEFEKLIRFLPISNFNIENLKKYVYFDENNKNHLRKIKYAYNQLKKYNNNKYWELNKEFNYNYWERITEEEKKTLYKLNNILNGENFQKNTENFIDEIKNKKEVLKNLSKNFYNMVFGTDSGMPIKSIIENYDVSEISNMLVPKANINFIKNDEIALLHLSDMHFDFDDSEEILNKKYLIITGDIICFHNMEKNYIIAEKYINYLIDELKINRNNVILCMGNHEIYAYNEKDNYKNIFENFDLYIKPKIENYSNFQHKINDKSIENENDMYYIKTYDKFTFFIINSLYYLDNKNNGLFLHDAKKVREILSTYIPENDKFKILVIHAQDIYTDDLNRKTNILDNFNIRFCGHKHLNQNIIQIDKQEYVDVISGNVDGLIEEKNLYNLYILNNNKLKVKKIKYNKKWSLE